MIIPLEKMISDNRNRYVFSRAVMVSVDRKDKIRDYPEGAQDWKVVPNVMKIVLDGKINIVADVKGE